MCHETITWPISGGAPSAAQLEYIERDDTKLPVYVAKPEGKGRRPAVVLVHDIHGPRDFYKDMAGRLAEEGYVTVLPDLFVRQAEMDASNADARTARQMVVNKDLALEDILATVRFARDRKGAEGPVGLIGFCMGGSLAMLSAGLVGGPDAVVSFYGFPQARKGWPKAPMDEVGSLRAPLLLIVGDQDSSVGMDNMASYEAKLDAANKDYESITYNGVGHGFLTFDPNAAGFAQASDAWTATLQFLDQQLANE